MYENDISCTLNGIIRGSLCSGIDQFPTLVLFHSFLNEFVSEKHFSFPFFSSFVLLADQWGGGGRGAWPPVHLSYSSNSGAAKICLRRQSKGVGGGFPTVGRFFKICV